MHPWPVRGGSPHGSPRPAPPTREIMAISGYRVAEEGVRYTASADQKKRAQRGMAK